MTAMEAFLKKIGPVGCGIFLVLMVLFFVLCITQSRDLLKGYEPSHEDAYYEAHPEALAEEIETRVAPLLPAVRSAAVTEDGGAVTVTVEAGEFFPVRRSLLRHFPASLLVLEKTEEAAG